MEMGDSFRFLSLSVGLKARWFTACPHKLAPQVPSHCINSFSPYLHRATKFQPYQ
jgi:hypothetical protein